MISMINDNEVGNIKALLNNKTENSNIHNRSSELTDAKLKLSYYIARYFQKW